MGIKKCNVCNGKLDFNQLQLCDKCLLSGEGKTETKQTGLFNSEIGMENKKQVSIPATPKKYQIIYADPPWEVKAGPRWSSSGKSQDLLYPTMKLEEIMALPIKEIAEENSHLYLWTINKYLEQSYEVARRWGFKVSCVITWCKKPHGLGLGGAFVQTTEHLLFCRRGKLPTSQRVDTTWIEHKRLKHSEKPQIFRDLILKASGDKTRIELFARQKTEGWDVWGNEVESDIDLTQGEL